MRQPSDILSVIKQAAAQNERVGQILGARAAPRNLWKETLVYIERLQVELEDAQIEIRNLRNTGSAGKTSVRQQGTTRGG